MMPPDVISHENQLQHLSEPLIFMLDVFRTADHAGQIFIPHRPLYIIYAAVKHHHITTSTWTDGRFRERERQAEREREWVSGRWRGGVGWHEEGNRWGIEGRVLLSNWRRRAEWEMLHFFVLLLMLQDASLFCFSANATGCFTLLICCKCYRMLHFFVLLLMLLDASLFCLAANTTGCSFFAWPLMLWDTSLSC